MAHTALLSPQTEVEQWFIRQGVLIPSFHQMYWLGLVAYEWPKFLPLDKSLPPPSRITYQHWADNRPNATQQCAGAHVNLASGNAWGWLDVSCSTKAVVLCRSLSEWRGWPHVSRLQLLGPDSCVCLAVAGWLLWQ